MTLTTREADAAFADLICADPPVAGRGVRRAGRGLLQRAARAAAARAAPGPAPPRQHAAALPADRPRPGRDGRPGHRAATWPAALAPGASPRPSPGPPPRPLTPRGRRPARQRIGTRAPPGRPRKGDKDKEPPSRTSWPPIRRGSLAGAPPRNSPGHPAAGPMPRSSGPPTTHPHTSPSPGVLKAAGPAVAVADKARDAMTGRGSD